MRICKNSKWRSFGFSFVFAKNTYSFMKKNKNYRRYDYEYKFSNYVIHSIGFRTRFNGS